MKLVFFASLREATGISETQLTVGNTQALSDWIRDNLTTDAQAALQAENVRIALNQSLTEWRLQDLGQVDSPLQEGDEVAFLPPVTGG